MRKAIKTEHNISTSAEKVWTKIAQGDGVEDWLPIIKSSQLEEGNRRVCEMHEGGNLEETILKSDTNRIFLYSIDKQSAFPAQNIVGTIRVEAAGDDASKLFWDVEMDVESEEVFNQIKPMIEGVYASSAEKLSTL